MVVQIAERTFFKNRKHLRTRNSPLLNAVPKVYTTNCHCNSARSSTKRVRPHQPAAVRTFRVQHIAPSSGRRSRQRVQSCPRQCVRHAPIPTNVICNIIVLHDERRVGVRAADNPTTASTITKLLLLLLLPCAINPLPIIHCILVATMRPAHLSVITTAATTTDR